MLVAVAPLCRGQHKVSINAVVDYETRIITVQEKIAFTNTGASPLNEIILNDWNNAYSANTTPLAKRFSDEFIWSFHRARQEERGSTTIQSIGSGASTLSYSRPDGHPDLVSVQLSQPLPAGATAVIDISYSVKIPSDRFTRYGYNSNGSYYLKDWYLVPARLEEDGFVKYSNENLDDIANSVCDYEVSLNLPESIAVATDLDVVSKNKNGSVNAFKLFGKGRNNFVLALEQKSTFEVYTNNVAEVSCNLATVRTTDIQRTVLIDQVTNFVKDNLGPYPQGKIMVSQTDYDRNPVYGLNQLPALLSPFPDDFLFELRFLKTYLNACLKNTLRIDMRKDSWIADGIQVYIMKQYIAQHHPEKMMTGAIGQWKILRGYHMFNINFNDQYTYFYLLMARKNLDQPIGDPKDTFIKFNEQIAGKYKAGMAFSYLDDYLGNGVVPTSLSHFYNSNLSTANVSREMFREQLSSSTEKDLNWFFDGMVSSREIIDYKFEKVREEKEALTITVKNKTGFAAPIPVYGVKNGKVSYKIWLENIAQDSTFTIPRGDADRIILNYENTVPEYNSRNNTHRLDKFFPNNKPIKFTFFQDLEDPRYNQIFFVPSFSFNLYDGFAPGLKLHNKSLLLERPIIFDINPTYSTKTGSLTGSSSFLYNQYVRDSNLFNIRYQLSGSTNHYAPNARYIKYTPSVQFRFRDSDLRRNFKQFLLLRYVTVDREASDYVITDKQNENYSVFNARFTQVENEATRLYSYNLDTQFANSFGKLSGEIQFRKLFISNRQVNLRLFAGTFLYRKTNTDFFSFGVDRVSDYLFDYGLYGRSETTGLFSRQFVLADGGFKSMFANHYANRWMAATNASFNIWNWVEVYGDAGFYDSTRTGTKFVYDSGVRLNLVPDYFELYLPVYSSNGWEFSNNYAEKIRFVVTIHPSTLISLFTRRWF